MDPTLSFKFKLYQHFLQDRITQGLMIFEHSHFMLMAFLNSGEFATLVNSTENLILATLNILFIQVGDRICCPVYLLNL